MHSVEVHGKLIKPIRAMSSYFFCFSFLQLVNTMEQLICSFVRFLWKRMKVVKNIIILCCNLI